MNRRGGLAARGQNPPGIFCKTTPLDAARFSPAGWPLAAMLVAVTVLSALRGFGRTRGERRGILGPLGGRRTGAACFGRHIHDSLRVPRPAWQRQLRIRTNGCSSWGTLGRNRVRRVERDRKLRFPYPERRVHQYRGSRGKGHPQDQLALRRRVGARACAIDLQVSVRPCLWGGDGLSGYARARCLVGGCPSRPGHGRLRSLPWKSPRTPATVQFNSTLG